DSTSDPLVLTGIGEVRDARYLLQVRLDPTTQPMDGLKCCLAAAGDVTVGSLATFTSSGAPLSSNGNVSVPGNIIGEVEANSGDRPDHVSGKVTAPAQQKTFPASSVVDTYWAKATAIPYSSTIEKVLLSRASNPYGQPNADGVYSINTG